MCSTKCVRSRKICCFHNTYLPSGSNHEQLIVMGYLILKTVILEIGYGVERILGAASPLRKKCNGIFRNYYEIAEYKNDIIYRKRLMSYLYFYQPVHIMCT